MMETTRVRFGSAIEWMIAAAFVLAAFAVGSIVVRELRIVTAATPVATRQPNSPTSTPHAGVPARAVSVPVLLLPGDRSVHVGDSVAAIAARLGREAEVGTQIAEPGRFGDRLTRFYELAGMRFVLVFEAFERGEAPRVAAIYLQ